jgi:hypothetical protein
VRRAGNDFNAKYADLLDENGFPEASASDPVIPYTVVSNSTSVFTGDGFLYAERDLNLGIIIARIELNGTVSAKSAPFGADTDLPEMAWTGSEARLTYGDFHAQPSGLFWTRLDRNGAAIGSTVAIPNHYNRSPIVAAGDDSLIFLGTNSGVVDESPHLDVVRLSPTGAVVTAPYTLVKDPYRPFASQPRLGLIGPDAIALWLHVGYPGAVELARLMP